MKEKDVIDPAPPEETTTTANDAPPEASIEEQEPVEATIQSVTLQGWEAARIGKHSAHIDKGLIVNFVDGKAIVSNAVADRLREAGVIE
ncbi:hypothetical protein OB236_38350 [Paenibacillus sp. WQ 127069]|uniref:Uncharacterized protein n=1 Tax=Paenibacillus baimaensis TaxID=2982185 RepID=A0ABT2UTN9_9BACL|nr:hypothetical protein [Paenibacillus sp. WQ 127069]MCU6798003.1 hypothetical protein [Paenibacillus sp. WQ 127069]